MNKTLLSLIGASALASGCSSERGYQSNLDNTYKSNVISSTDIGNKDITADFGFDRYAFTKELNSSRNIVQNAAGRDLASTEYFPFAAVSEKRRRTVIPLDSTSTKITHSEQKDTYTVFTLADKVTSIRTTIPVTREEGKGLVAKMDLGNFKVPTLKFVRTLNGKSSQEVVGYCSSTETDSNGVIHQVPVIIRHPQLVPNYDAGVMEIEGRFYVGRSNNKITEINLTPILSYTKEATPGPVSGEMIELIEPVEQAK